MYLFFVTGVLNSAVFIECDGVRALLRNAILIPSSHMVEAICGSLLFLLNKPSTRNSAKIDLRYLISGYTNSAVVEKNRYPIFYEILKIYTYFIYFYSSAGITFKVIVLFLLSSKILDSCIQRTKSLYKYYDINTFYILFNRT